jgi:glycerophosphoryl diester phosphodiesterase
MAAPPPLLIAGATGYGAWPANSLEGCLECLKAPVDGIEIDVQMTSDGHVVAHHDYRLTRSQTRLDGAWIAERSAPLKTLSLADLRRYDVGRSRPGSGEAIRHPNRRDMDGVRIPTLPELLAVLKAAPGARRLIYVEIKTDPQDPDDSPAPEAITEAVFRDLEAADYVDHAKIIAFDWRVLRRSEARSPGVKTAHLTIPEALRSTVKPGPDGRSPWADGCDAADHGGSDLAATKAHGGMEWSPYYTDVTAESMAEAQGLGLKVGPWGLSRGDDIRRMAELGVYSSTVSGPDWGA